MSSRKSDIHFFKKIEEDTLRNGDLRVPRGFVNKCWEGISNPVLLLLPNGAKWVVKWKKLDADIWLIDDWKKFAEFYSLDQDHLLVFRYVGGSQFQVIILDQSGLEMGYPLTEETLDGEENGNSLGQRKRAKSPLPFSPTKKVKTNPRKKPFSRSTKKVKTNPRTEPNCYPSQDVKGKGTQSRRTNADDFGNAKPKNRGGKEIMHANSRRSKSKAIQSEELCALERAMAFRSDNPFFICEMRPSYIRRNVLVMPRKFNIITEQQRKEDDSVTLRTSEDRTWVVKLCLNRCSGQITLTTNWKNFAMANDLKIGNVCVFEQIKLRGISFRVHIYRDGEESSPSMIPAREDGAEGSKQTELQNSFAKRGSDGIPKTFSGNNVFDDSEIPRSNNKMSENHFPLSIQPKQLHHESIPMELIGNHEIDNINNVTLRIGNISLPVRLSKA